MKKLACALIVLIAVGPATAQYNGPTIAVTTVANLLSSGKDDQPVALQGKLVRHLGGENYRFADATGEVTVEIEQEHWPAGVRIDDKTAVRIHGEFERNLIGESEVEVERLEAVQ